MMGAERYPDLFDGVGRDRSCRSRGRTWRSTRRRWSERRVDRARYQCCPNLDIARPPRRRGSNRRAPSRNTLVYDAAILCRRGTSSRSPADSVRAPPEPLASALPTHVISSCQLEPRPSWPFARTSTDRCSTVAAHFAAEEAARQQPVSGVYGVRPRGRVPLATVGGTGTLRGVGPLARTLPPDATGVGRSADDRSPDAERWQSATWSASRLHETCAPRDTHGAMSLA